MHRMDQYSYRRSFCLLSALLKGWFIADLFLCELLLFWLEVSYQIFCWERCRVQWEGKVEPLCSRNVESLSAALVQQRVWSSCVIPCHGQQPQSVLLPSPLLLVALHLKTNQRSSLEIKKKRNKKALQHILKDKQHSHQWHRSCCWCAIACSWLCQQLWMCLLPLALPCVVFTQSHSLHPHLPGRNAAKPRAALCFLCI